MGQGRLPRGCDRRFKRLWDTHNYSLCQEPSPASWAPAASTYRGWEYPSSSFTNMCHRSGRTSKLSARCACVQPNKPHGMKTTHACESRNGEIQRNSFSRQQYHPKQTVSSSTFPYTNRSRKAGQNPPTSASQRHTRHGLGAEYPFELCVVLSYRTPHTKLN